MSDDHKDCCPDCKVNAQGLEELFQLALHQTQPPLGSRLMEIATKGTSASRIAQPVPRSPYKEMIGLSGKCEGMAGETREVRITTEHPCKPQKMIIIETPEKTTSFGMRLANGPYASLFPPHLPDMVESEKFSAEAQALGCGIGLPALHPGDAYVFKFKFEKDAKVHVLLSCVRFRS